MSATDKIQAVLDAGLLTSQLMIIPTRGATEDEIRQEESLLGRALCPEHVAILRRWNGIALEVVRLFGCGDSAGEVGRLSALQIKGDFGVDGPIVVGADASGFTYIQSADRRVFSLDTDGGEFKLLADNLDDFVERLVFGSDAASFAGQEWLSELRDAGIVN